MCGAAPAHGDRTRVAAVFLYSGGCMDPNAHRYINFALQRETAEEFARLRAELKAATPHNPACAGWQSRSQNDEDGIIQECLRRIAAHTPLSQTCMEFGCGDGMQNNTHYLILGGYKAFWVDGNPDHIAAITEALGGLIFPKLYVKQTFVSLENLDALLAEAIAFLRTRELDCVSMDFDGNDVYFTRRILEHTRPKLVCVEYNANFPIPLSLCVEYDAGHAWDGTDYYGASLQAWIDALGGYTLVACTVSGVNAFFVRNDLMAGFSVYPAELLYQRPRYWLAHCYTGHRGSFRWLRNILGPPRDCPSP